MKAKAAAALNQVDVKDSEELIYSRYKGSRTVKPGRYQDQSDDLIRIEVAELCNFVFD